MAARLSLSFYGEEQQMNSRTGANHKTRTQTAIVTCPDCGDKIVLKGLIHVGRQVLCESCEAKLEVVSMTPVKVNGVVQEPKDEQAFLVRW